MMKKAFPVFIGILLLGIVGVLLFAKDFEVVVTETQAQNAIDTGIAQGPIEQFGTKVAVNSAQIDFKANDSAEIQVDLSADGHGYSGDFEGKVASSVELRSARIYLHDLALIEGGFTTDAETQGELGEMKKVATDFFRRVRSDKTDDSGQPLDSSAEKSAEILETFVTKATHSFFESIPIYDLRNLGPKGQLIGLAVKEVTYTENEAVIVISPVQALINILLMLGFCILSLWWFLSSVGIGFPQRKSTGTDSEV